MSLPFTFTRPAWIQLRASTREPRPAFESTRSSVLSGRFRVRSLPGGAMKGILCVAALLLCTCPVMSQAGPEAHLSFDVASIKPSEPGDRMAMLRTLLVGRFHLAFHREPREAPVYDLTVARGGPALKETATPSEVQPVLVNRLFPGRVQLPARNATMAQFASMLQRSVLDRHVLDKTGLSARYDFDLEWTPDETQFGGQLPPVPAADDAKPDLFAAMQQQLGLRLQPSRELVDVIVIDHAERP